MTAASATSAQSICFAIADLGPGGAQRVLTTLANAWVAAGRTVTIVTYEERGSDSFYPLSEAIAVRRLDAMADATSAAHGVVANIGRIRRVRAAIRAVEPDVIISFVDVMNVIVLLAALGMRIPVLVCERTDPARAPLPVAWRLARRCSYPLARNVLVQTEAIAGYFRPWLGKRVAVIPNPIQSAGDYHADDSVAGARPPTIVAVGRLSDEKCFDRLMQAFGDVAKRFPDWRLTIHGEGPLRADLEARRDSLGLSGRVSLPGLTAKIADIYGKADIFVLSSRFEGFPNALCEAMSFGLPVIATECSSAIPEIVTHGTDGIVVPNGDREALAQALSDLMADTETRSRLGEKAKAIRDRYSLAAVLAMWEDVIAQNRTATA